MAPSKLCEIKCTRKCTDTDCYHYYTVTRLVQFGSVRFLSHLVPVLTTLMTRCLIWFLVSERLSVSSGSWFQNGSVSHLVPGFRMAPSLIWFLVSERLSSASWFQNASHLLPGFRTPLICFLVSERLSSGCWFQSASHLVAGFRTPTGRCRKRP